MAAIRFSTDSSFWTTASINIPLNAANDASWASSQISNASITGIDHINETVVALTETGIPLSANIEVNSVGNFTANYLPSGVSWTSINLNSLGITNSSSVWDLTYANGLWVGLSDSMIKSTDLISWTTQSGLPNDAIEYGNGTWVVSGQLNSLFVSTNNTQTWTSVNPGFGSTNRISSLAYGNGLWVAGAQNTPDIRISTNATSWSGGINPFLLATQGITAMAYGNGLWVLGTVGAQLRTSTDGVSWVTRNVNMPGTNISAIAYGNGVWVAAGSSSMRRSTDGISWNTVVPNFGSSFIYSVKWGGGFWVAGGDSGQIRTSTDAITWTTRSSNSFSGVVWGLAYGNDTWMAAGSFLNARISKDRNLFNGLSYSKVFDFNNSFIFLNENSNTYYSGSDLNNLSLTSLPLSTTPPVQSPGLNYFYTNGTDSVLLGKNGYLYRYSNSNPTWQRQNIGTSEDLSRIAYSPDVGWVVTTNSIPSTLYISTNLTTWTTQSFPVTSSSITDIIGLN